MVNLALRLRVPLLVTGGPGTGKSSVAYRIARELRLGRVLHWQVTSRASLHSGLYAFDTVGRLADGPVHSIGDLVRLGPVGTAMLGFRRPRVLLIDDLDNGDVDLPLELLHVLYHGEFSVQELTAVRRREPEVTVSTDDPDVVATVHGGRIRCHVFPIVVITSNGEREYPPGFLRRCLHLRLPSTPGADELTAMVRAHIPSPMDGQPELIADFVRHAAGRALSPDQLLNAMFLSLSGIYSNDPEARQRLITAVWHPLMEL